VKRHLSTGLLVLVVGALGALVLMSFGRGTAAAAQYQYGSKPRLTLSVLSGSGGYTFRLVGVGYSNTQPGGALRVTCTNKAPSCGGSPQWPAGGVAADGSFVVDFFKPCGSNVKSAVAVDSNGLKSNGEKGAC